MLEKTCLTCGKTYHTWKKSGKYCSRLCAHQGWVAEHSEQWREYNAEWRRDHPDYWREYYNDGRGVVVQARRHAKHPLERKARGAISNALHLGKMVRPNNCQICGAAEKLEAHHWRGYEKEHWLDVQWLCHAHHLEAERNML
jgi:hypothetical protein